MCHFLYWLSGEVTLVSLYLPPNRVILVIFNFCVSNTTFTFFLCQLNWFIFFLCQLNWFHFLSASYQIEGCEVIWAIKDASISCVFIDPVASDFLLPDLNKPKKTEKGPLKRMAYTLQADAKGDAY